MGNRGAVYFDNVFAARFLVEQVDILCYDRLQHTFFFQIGENGVYDCRLFFAEPVYKLLGHTVVHRRIPIKDVDIEHFFGIRLFIKPVFASEVPNSRKRTNPRSRKHDKMLRLRYKRK